MITQFQLVKEGKVKGFTMPFDKLRALNREFPWLYAILKLIPGQVYVMQATTEVFSLPVTRTGRGFDLDPYCFEELWLIDENGCVLEHTSRVPIMLKRWLLFGPYVERILTTKLRGKMSLGDSWTYGNVYDLMRAMGSSVERIRYILSFHKSTGAAIIYKIPKGSSAKDLMVEHMK